jgi:heme exporter protein D
MTLTSNWASLQAFIDMGGYGGYVWGAVGVSLLALAVESWLLHRQQRQLHAAAAALEETAA